MKSQDPKGKMKFERTPDIPVTNPVIAGDGITYGVACLQFLDSSLKFDILAKKFLMDTQFFSNVKFC